MPESFRPGEILAVLGEHGVSYVLIGGLAAALHGSPHLTQDVDIAPERSLENLARLSDALRALQAKIRARGVDEPLPFSHNAESLQGVGVWNLSTPFGDLDISFVPTGTEGFADLRRGAVTLDVGGTTVMVADLSDIVRSKQAAGRPKDQLTLPTLRELLARRLDDPGPASD